MEYCEGGDMGQLIKKCRREKDFIAEDVIWKIFMQIAQALNECHHRPEGKVLHRDLKPGNIFLDGNNNVKLGDFGLSRVLTAESQYASTHVGTPYYMSPEQITESRYNEKSDIWSAGCVLYEIAALRPPFEAANQIALAMKIKTGRFDRLPLRYSEELQKVLMHMLRINPEERPKTEDLLGIPQIALRIKEGKLKEHYAQLKHKEEGLSRTQKELEEKEREMLVLQEKLESRQKELESSASSSSASSGGDNKLGKNMTMDNRSEKLLCHEASVKDRAQDKDKDKTQQENKDPNRGGERQLEKNHSQPLLLAKHTRLRGGTMATEGKPKAQRELPKVPRLHQL